jgi:hypothetical protein
MSCNKQNKQSSSLNNIDSHEMNVSYTIETKEKENLGKEINDQVVFLGNDSLKTTMLSELVKRPNLFFFFSEQTCTPCVENTVECIKAVFPDYESDSEIYFISPDYPIRFRINCYGKQLLTLEESKLGLKLENETVPFLFTIDTTLKVNHIHVVNKENFDRTLHFLQRIKSKKE